VQDLMQDFGRSLGPIHTWAGEKSWGGGFCLYLYVISFDLDSGVGIPLGLTFCPGGGVNTLANPTPPAPCVVLSSHDSIFIEIFYKILQFTDNNFCSVNILLQFFQ